MKKADTLDDLADQQGFKDEAEEAFLLETALPYVSRGENGPKTQENAVSEKSQRRNLHLLGIPYLSSILTRGVRARTSAGVNRNTRMPSAVRSASR